MIDIYEAGSKVSAWRASYFTSNSVEMRWKIQITVRRTLTATLTNCQYERYHVDNNNNHRQQQTSTFPIRRFTMVCTLICDGSLAVIAIVERTRQFYFHCKDFFLGFDVDLSSSCILRLEVDILPESARSRALP